MKNSYTRYKAWPYFSANAIPIYFTKFNEGSLQAESNKLFQRNSAVRCFERNEGKQITKMKFRKLIAGVSLLAIFISLPIAATAADIRSITLGSTTYRALVLEGTIESGDYEKFIKIIRDYQGQISGFWIFSPGGDFYEAMKIGRALRALELPSFVPSKGPRGQPECSDFPGVGGFLPKPNDPKNCTCASAGFFIHIGSVSRNGTFLAVHRPYFEKGKFGELSESEAKKAFDTLQERARDYMLEMGVPKHIQEDVLGTSSERALILDDKTVETFFLGSLPYRHEWIRNKCSRLSTDETERSEGYSRRFRKARSATNVDFSKDEWTDLSILQKKQKEEQECEIAVDNKSRKDAFIKFYGITPK